MILEKQLLHEIRSLNEAKKYQHVIDKLNNNLLKEYTSADLYAEKAEAYFRLKQDELCNMTLSSAPL